jgi:hypothetical protein
LLTAIATVGDALYDSYQIDGDAVASVLLAALGQEETITMWQAKAIPMADEESNIDFVWDTKSGVRIFCKVKLSDSAEGSWSHNPVWLRDRRAASLARNA